ARSSPPQPRSLSSPTRRSSDLGLRPGRRKQSGCRRSLARGGLVRLLKRSAHGSAGRPLAEFGPPEHCLVVPGRPAPRADEGGNMHTDTNSSPLPTMRRTLLIGLGAAALTFSPIQAQADTAAPSQEATSAADASTLGPDGYKSLELGMSEEEALATGLITDRQQVGDC